MEATLSSQSVKSSPRDVFMYLFATIALYFSVWSVIQLLLQYISVLFPDPLNPYFDPGSTVRWSMALLVIIFPAYCWVSRFLRRDLLAHPEKSEIRARKWLLYLTLFLAALLIIGDLVALIYSFLEGEITTRFFLKIIAILIVAAAVFWYYLRDLRTNASSSDARMTLFARLAIAAVALIVVGGFFVVGSPFRQRLVRFDSQKASDLQNIQWQIVSFWQKKEVLPQKIEDLRDDISGYIPPRDPQSGEAYDYQPTDALAFRLCANFNTSSNESSANEMSQVKLPVPVGGGGTSENWRHGEGRVCFERTIDPALYPLEKTLLKR
ncbi:MAG: hypothetical protein A2946_00655 [Candidatus Liptonbacteria bacterium RIFCSPLOWO2_01_FULL_53_13]|uniref:DUF5671 domain-containing protein n=1 Tax=Candidatus Liptonbacteria bacterium RIFCSPLOWO2_01_FULL_53_13 TaxID=1798651 RepID=A0A1G2CIL0_9BACT|nr:MAG: hypothetical protein A2946_00655 [Candidatus Liptonbacteria bacterium RIFCSPLOWO2_01_FULL_53_13]